MDLVDQQGMLVAFSGGPDSTALLLSLLAAGVPVVAAHFDHDLRRESAAEAEWLRGRCREWGVPLIVGRRSRPLIKGSVQAAARTARYEFLEEALAESGQGSVALGHTADDLVEGTLMHLLRGTGLAGMRGMPERRGPFVRPLLHVWRSQIESYLRGLGVAALNDPSNLDVRHERIRIRLVLLPALERDRPGIGLRMHGAALFAGRLQAAVEDAAQALVAAHGLALDALARATPAVRAQALCNAYCDLGGPRPSLSRRHHTAMTALIEFGSAGQTLDLPGGVRIRRGYGYVEMIGMVKPSMVIQGSLRLSNCTGCGAGGAAHFPIGTQLSLGGRRPGLNMRPLPGGRLRKLQDILVDAKVPRHTRDELPLVFADGELAWVPGIALDRRWASFEGRPSIHVEVVGSGNALLESVTPTQGVLS